jgi:hypothetical protein
MTYVPKDQNGRPKKWFYYLVALIFIAAFAAMTIAYISRH